MSFLRRGFGLTVVVGVLALTYMWGRWDESTNRPMPLAGVAHAAASAPSASPVGVVDPRDVYYPGSEALAPDEMRVVACGTGMPNQRPKQAAACWLVELGNGDKFLFDIGSESTGEVQSLFFHFPENSLDFEEAEPATKASDDRRGFQDGIYP